MLPPGVGLTVHQPSDFTRLEIAARRHRPHLCGVSSSLTVTRKGPASAGAMWARYVDPKRWPEWSPHIRDASLPSPIKAGTHGEVRSFFGLRIPVHVLAVDSKKRTWSWEASIAGASVTMVHVVRDGETEVRLSGPDWLVRLYAPLAGVALGRLVRVTEDAARAEAPVEKPAREKAHRR